jgi:hypothetical protein
MELTIHSYSVDWLYQALLYIFSGTIKKQIEEAMDNALHTVGGAGLGLGVVRVELGGMWMHMGPDAWQQGASVYRAVCQGHIAA